MQEPSANIFMDQDDYCMKSDFILDENLYYKDFIQRFYGSENFSITFVYF